MSKIVDGHQIEALVGIARHQTRHYGRADSTRQEVYILHSAECLQTEADLRECPFSRALDLGVDLAQWIQDEPVVLTVGDGHLAPRTTW